MRIMAEPWKSSRGCARWGRQQNLFFGWTRKARRSSVCSAPSRISDLTPGRWTAYSADRQRKPSDSSRRRTRWLSTASPGRKHGQRWLSPGHMLCRMYLNVGAG